MEVDVSMMTVSQSQTVGKSNEYNIKGMCKV